MKFNKKWIISLAAVVGLVLVGTLAFTVIADRDWDNDGGQETAPDADETFGSWFGADDVNAQNLSPTVAPAESEEEENESGEGSEANEGAEVNEGSEANEAAPSDVTVKLTPEQAKQIVLDAHPGVMVTNVKLEYEGETLVYEVTLGDGAEVYVDPNTGEILTLEDDD